MTETTAQMIIVEEEGNGLLLMNDRFIKMAMPAMITTTVRVNGILREFFILISFPCCPVHIMPPWWKFPRHSHYTPA
jgi:hypothetical protein